jgi:hypothetical protein
MKQQLELTPLQVKYLQELVEKDKPTTTENRFLKDVVKKKLQHLRNEFAIEVGKACDESLSTLKAKEDGY